jgi:hypothetical protein
MLWVVQQHCFSDPLWFTVDPDPRQATFYHDEDPDTDPCFAITQKVTFLPFLFDFYKFSTFLS